MGELDWQGACQDMKLENGVFWPVPVTLSATSELADRIRIGQEVVLVDTEGGQPPNGSHEDNREVPAKP